MKHIDPSRTIVVLYVFEVTGTIILLDGVLETIPCHAAPVPWREMSL
jgi:hypothetical protein